LKMNLGTGVRVGWAGKFARAFVAWMQETRDGASAWLRSDEPLAQRAAGALGAVAVLHAIFLATVFWGLRISAPQTPPELHVSFYGPQPVDRTLAAPPPDIPVMQPPEIIIADDTPALAYLAAPAASVLAPRPDPNHSNPIPTSADLAITISAQAVVILRLIVDAEGGVMQATVVRSSGQNGLDAAIEAFVKDKWRFLPATLNGAPIQYPTTATIPLQS
jgi:TonB family protein